jgi:DNA-binding LacI/PurR family transcriptional regulator
MSGAGSRPPTIADVASAAGVSRTTVSHALNGLGNLRAQRLRRGEAKAIALASSMPVAVAAGPSRLGFYMEIAAAAAESALLHGYALVLVPPVHTGSALHSVDIDGAIVVEPDANDVAAAQLRERGLPYVALGRPVSPEEAAPYIDLRGGLVAEKLLDHLREQGAARPALIIGAGERHAAVDARAAYERVCAEHGWTPIVAAAPEAGGEQAGYEACAELLARHPGIDAVCALVDAFAVGAIRAVKDSGRAVPDDVMVVTRYDGLRARTCEPPLTAVDLHLDRAASDAVELLLARLRGDVTTGAAVTSPEPRVIPRASSLRVAPRAGGTPG